MEEQQKKHPPRGPWPQLVYLHGEKQTFYSMGKENGNSCCYVCSIPELHDKKVWNCCHGWLVLSKGASSRPRQFSIWNPVTLENIELPRLIPTHTNACILSAPPSEPSCELILLDAVSKCFWVCRLGDDRKCWSRVAYNTEYHLYKPIYYNGKLFAFTSSWTVVEFTGLICRTLIPLPRPREQTTLVLSWDSVESCEELYVVTLMFEKHELTEKVLPHGINHVEVHKLDSSSTTMTWKRVTSINDRAFYICDLFAFSCSSSGIGSGNRIYFPLEEERCLYTYDIEEETMSVSLPCPNLTTPWMRPCWIMPDIRLFDSSAEAAETSGKEEEGSVVECLEKHAGETERNLFGILWNGVTYISRKLNIFTYENSDNVVSVISLKEPLALLEWRHSMVEGLESSPVFLLYFQKNRGHFTFINPENSQKYVEVCPQFLKDGTICHCKDGWLLMCKYIERGRLCVNFVNPFTKDVVSYPDLFLKDLRYSRFGFSSSPTCLDCVVIVLTFSRNNSNEVGLDICNSRKEGWVHLKLSSYSCCDAQTFKSHIYLNRAFYFLSPSGKVGVLRLLQEEEKGVGCEWRVLEEPKKPYLSFCQCFLDECGGELYSVFIRDMGRWLCVFKFDNSSMVWKRIKSFEKHTMYISRLSTLFLEAKSPQIEDKIYFPRFYGKEEAMVSYSLGRSKYCHPSASESSSEDYYGTKEPLVCCWIQPS